MDEVLTLKQAADYLGVSPEWLVQEGLKGTIPMDPKQFFLPEGLVNVKPPPEALVKED
jgi:hypothetical protein